MRNTILSIALLLLMPMAASAQFYTITQDQGIEPAKAVNTVHPMENSEEKKKEKVQETLSDSLAMDKGTDRRMDKSTSKEKHSSKATKKIEASSQAKDKAEHDGLPDLTLANLYHEIKRNGILFPKIVLAQAILETGWFRSSACRMKNNLFGLTNPKTGQYFTFGHWTESVRAYYTKVQYRYKGGNYLLWLRKIGYAEDQGYIRAVIRVLRML